MWPWHKWSGLLQIVCGMYWPGTQQCVLRDHWLRFTLADGQLACPPTHSVGQHLTIRTSNQSYIFMGALFFLQLLKDHKTLCFDWGPHCLKCYQYFNSLATLQHFKQMFLAMISESVLGAQEELHMLTHMAKGSLFCLIILCQSQTNHKVANFICIINRGNVS